MNIKGLLLPIFCTVTTPGLLCLGLQAYAKEISDTRYSEDKVETFNHYFVTVGNFQDRSLTDTYTEVTVTTKNGLPNAISNSKSYRFAEHIVSQACGNHISRCRELTIIQQDSNQLFLLPFTRAVGIMKFEDTGSTLLHVGTYVLEYIYHPDCTTLTIIEFKRKPYSVCVNSANRLISCSVNINLLNLTQSYLQCSSLGDHSLDIKNSDFSFISNFVNTGNDVFIFAVKDLLYKYYPERTALRLISPQCRLPHSEPNTRLVFNEQRTLLVYYTMGEDSVVVPFNTDEECWEYSYANNHLEYTCFNGFNIFVYPVDSAILFERQEPEEGISPRQFGIVGTHFITGKCFGNSSLIHFVYTDRVNGTVLLDISLQQNIVISNSTICTDRNVCQVPIVYQDRYLTIRRKDEIQVIDIQPLHQVIEAHLDIDHVRLVGFFTGAVYETDKIIKDSEDSGKNNKQGLLPSIAGGVIGIFLLLSFGGVCILVWHMYRDSRVKQRRLNRRRQNVHISHTLYSGVHGHQCDEQSERDQNDHQQADTVVTITAQNENNIQTSQTNTDQDGNTANEDTSERDLPSQVDTPDSPVPSILDLSNVNSSLSELYPERGPLPHQAIPRQLEAPDTLSITTASSMTSVGTSVQGMRREQYVVPGASASNENLSMLSPVQVSQQQSNLALKHDCSSVLTTESLTAGAVEASLVTDTQSPGGVTTLDFPVTRSGVNMSRPLELNNHDVLIEPIPASSSTPPQSLIATNY